MCISINTYVCFFSQAQQAEVVIISARAGFDVDIECV